MHSNEQKINIFQLHLKAFAGTLPSGRKGRKRIQRVGSLCRAVHVRRKGAEDTFTGSGFKKKAGGNQPERPRPSFRRQSAGEENRAPTFICFTVLWKYRRVGWRMYAGDSTLAGQALASEAKGS